VATLQSSDLWKNNQLVSTWLMNTWLSMPKVREAYMNGQAGWFMNNNG